jgi:hypothetical protein
MTHTDDRSQSSLVVDKASPREILRQRKFPDFDLNSCNNI